MESHSHGHSHCNCHRQSHTHNKCHGQNRCHSKCKCKHRNNCFKYDKAFIYAYNNSLVQNINSCDQENKLVNFSINSINENIDFNGTDTFTILQSGTYEAIFSVNARNAATDNANENLSFKLLRNGIVVPGSVYLTNAESNKVGTVNGNVKFEACANDIIQLSGNTTYPVIISSINSPFGDKTNLTGMISQNTPVSVTSSPIATKANSSVYITVSNRGYCRVTNITDGTNNYTKATEDTFFNGNGIVQIWYLDNVPESNSYTVDITMSSIISNGAYEINVYNILGTENPSLDAIGTLNPIIGTVVSNDITSTKKNDIALMAFGKATDVGSPLFAEFPNNILDSTPITADIYQALGDIGTYTIAVNATLLFNVSQTAVSVAIKFADNSSICDSPINASIDLKLL